MEFNSLPLEIQLEIFSYLPVRQALEIRRVCKHWNGLIKAEFKIKRLSCHQLKSPEQHFGHEFYFVSIRLFLDYTKASPMFSQVKFLRAGLQRLNYAHLDDAFELLNSFRYLRETSFICYVSDSDDLEAIERKQFVVSLDHLEKAKLIFAWRTFASRVSVVLDLPCLHHLEVCSLRELTLKYPERLRTLQTSQLIDGNPNYSKFTGLRGLCTYPNNVRSITATFIESLPSLRRVYLDELDEFSNLDRSPEPGKVKVKIFYLGIQVTLNQINTQAQGWPRQIYYNVDSTFIARNLHQSVDWNPRVCSIDYNTIARELNDAEMFEVVPRKFPRIDSLYIIGAVADPNRLLKFIGRFPIKELELKRAFLRRWFFEKLPESGPSIRQIEIRREPTMDILSSDFVFKLNDLKNFRIEDCPVPLNFIARLLRKQQSINYVTFEQESYSIRLYQYRGTWHIDLNVEEIRFNDTWWIDLDVEEVGLGVGGRNNNIQYGIPGEEAVEFANILSSRLKADGSPKELLVLLRQLELEKGTHLFMMRKFVYEQRHSIGMSKEFLVKTLWRGASDSC